MKTSQVILIGGSAGSLPVLFQFLKELPADFSWPMVIVVHRKAGRRSFLPELMQKNCQLRVREVSQFDQLQGGQVYLAPADYHLLVSENGRFELDYSEKVLFCRPSIDVSLASFAAVYGARLIAVILSGANSDGAAGAKQVKRQKGKLIVQLPEEAEVATMPQAVLETNIHVDQVVASTGLKETLLKHLSHE